MNPIALYLASGESLYVGAALLLALVFLRPHRLRNSWLPRIRMLLIWIGLAMMALACPPFPAWLDTVFIAAFLAWMMTASTTRTTKLARRSRAGFALIFVLLLVALPALEFPHRFLPTITPPPTGHLTVIGDSISAGITNQPTWPQIFERETNIPVKNLSTAGAELSDAILAARKLTPDDHLLLLEIGGNDMISGLTAREFESRLRTLFAQCAATDRTLIMFELPLLPHRIAYGPIQRQLAAEFHVQLIPKRFLIRVLAGTDATSDGLHLAPAGAAKMAKLVAATLAAK